ncbi:MAG TPA: hypothetical protein VNN07_19420 [Candidatus Tectomicrobia bacterium]|nr:hypothetical protein [Candidatus Tectomicrobia bacterium]
MAATLLGFDLRETDGAVARLWTPERRARFLLRRDAAPVLSVDVAVWPSVFDTGQGIGLAAAERERWRFAGLPTPPWTGANDGLWEDLAAMRAHAAAQAATCPPHVAIAVTWLQPDGVEPGPVGPHPAATHPAAPDPAWPCAGLDVADGSRLSGLSNCGYGEDEAAALVARWAPRLNRWHLFDDPQDALAFREVADARIPEHAPFFVYGLYLVDGAAAVLAAPGGAAAAGSERR